VASFPAGWYFDPWSQGHRYWDGAAWTNHFAPLPPQVALAQAPKKTANGDWIGAVLLPLVMPAIGLIAGAIWALMGGTKRQPGLICLGASAAMLVAYWVAFNMGS
jgi:hypothetical protein